jgi:predicted AlkP superfamily pyrophosphatase or phosphodiesterase
LRVLIVGLDSAEYDVIAPGNYPHLKQAEYGRVVINVRPIFTPIVWASFITGAGKEAHGVHGLHKWRSGLIDRLRDWLLEGTLPRKIGKHLEVGAAFLESIGIKPRFYDRSDIRVSTIFDYVDKHIAVSIPSYNEDSVNATLKEKEVEALRSGSRRLMNEAEALAWKIFRAKRKRVLDLLREDWNLFMVHFYVLDPLQHLFWYDSERLARAYEEADNTAKLIQDRMPEDCLLLIVSDHGQKKGVHTPYGFYSCNLKLELNDPKITDFAGIIRSQLGLPTREEEIAIYKRLKRLGYV